MFPPQVDLTILRPGIARLLGSKTQPTQPDFKTFIYTVKTATDSDKTANQVLDLFIEPCPTFSGHFRFTEVVEDLLANPARPRTVPRP